MYSLGADPAQSIRDDMLLPVRDHAHPRASEMERRLSEESKRQVSPDDRLKMNVSVSCKRIVSFQVDYLS